MNARIWAPLATAFLVSAQPVAAAELFGGVFAHDIDLGPSACCSDRGVDIQGGMRSNPIVSLAHLGDLRAYGLGSVDSTGRAGFAAVGLAWRLHLTQAFYLQSALGLAVQGGGDPRRVLSGSGGARVRLEPELGVGYRVSTKWAVELAYARLTRVPFAGSRNSDTDNLGVRLVYRLAR